MHLSVGKFNFFSLQILQNWKVKLQRLSFVLYLGNLIYINPILGTIFIIENLSCTEEVGQGMLAY